MSGDNQKKEGMFEWIHLIGSATVPAFLGFDMWIDFQDHPEHYEKFLNFFTHLFGH